MITLLVFKKRGDEEPLITYVGNITFKLHKGTLFVFGASKDYDVLDCKALQQRNINNWYAYIEV